jgi:hypothetical protein
MEGCVESYPYAYLVGCVFFVAVWGACFLFMKLSRKAIWWASITLVWVAPLFEWLNKDYWRPEFLWRIEIGPFFFGIESLLLGFSVIGISAGIFDWRYRKSARAEVVAEVTRSSYWRLFMAGLLAAVPIVALTFIAKINSVHAHIYVCTALAVLVIWRVNWEWKLPSVITSLVLAFVMAVFYYGFYLRRYPGIIDAWWIDEVLWGPKFWDVPLEEFLWGASNALYLGAVIRYCMDKGFEIDMNRQGKACTRKVPKRAPKPARTPKSASMPTPNPPPGT